MNKKTAIFFGIKDLDYFFKQILLKKMSPSLYDYKIINEATNNFAQKKNCIFHEGYTYRQKNSFVIFRNNEIDGWINLIRIISLENKLKSVFLSIDNETNYPSYQLYYYEK